MDKQWKLSTFKCKRLKHEDRLIAAFQVVQKIIREREMVIAQLSPEQRQLVEMFGPASYRDAIRFVKRQELFESAMNFKIRRFDNFYDDSVLFKRWFLGHSASAPVIKISSLLG